LKTINDGAFQNCVLLEEVVIGNSLESIGDYAFYETNLSSISFPDSLSRGGGLGFGNSASLQTLILGPGSVGFNSTALSDCAALSSIHFRGKPKDPSGICEALAPFQSLKIYVAGGFNGTICGRVPRIEPTPSPGPTRTAAKSPDASRSKSPSLSMTAPATCSPSPTPSVSVTRPASPTRPATQSPPTQSRSPEDHRKRNIIVGVSVGLGSVIVGLVVVVVVVVVAWRKARKKNLDHRQVDTLGEGLLGW
jgi:hypothetical protein